MQVGSFILSADLIILGMKDYDVILGMDWLSTYRAVMDYFNKTVRLQVLADCVEIVGERRPMTTRVISSSRADRLIRSRCEGYVAFVMEDKLSKAVKDIPVVCEFPDVFPEEIPGLPMVREIDFTIKLVPGMAPISKAPYRMAPACRAKGAESSVAGTLGQRVYETECITLGCTGSVREKKGWIDAYVHRLQTAESGYNQEQESFTQDR